jgi:hypothetical protein
MKREFKITVSMECRQLHYKSFEQIAIEMKKTKRRLEKQGYSFDFVYCVFDNNNLPFEDYQK